MIFFKSSFFCVEFFSIYVSEQNEPLERKKYGAHIQDQKLISTYRISWLHPWHENRKKFDTKTELF